MSITARLLERGFESRLREIGLTRITWCILLATGPGGLNQPSDIAGFVGIDRTATSRALRQMEDQELIARKGGQDDKRTTRVVLTDKALGLLDRASKFARDNAARFNAKLTSKETADLRALLAKLRSGEDCPLSRL